MSKKSASYLSMSTQAPVFASFLLLLGGLLLVEETFHIEIGWPVYLLLGGLFILFARNNHA